MPSKQPDHRRNKITKAGRPHDFLTANTIAWLSIAVAGAALRALHLSHGLPNLEEEAFPFRRAIAMWGADGSSPSLNPHWFAYPSLTLYVQYFLQHLGYWASGLARPADYLLRLSMDPSHAVLAARFVSVFADTCTIALAGYVLRPFGRLPRILTMVMISVSPWMIETSRNIFADSLMCTFVLASVAAMVRYQAARRIAGIFVAAVLAGFAMGCKYPAAGLIAPLLLVAPNDYRTPRKPALRVTAAFVMLAAFLLTTPFLLTSWHEVVRDATYMLDTTRSGGLGHLSGSTVGFYFAGLLANLGIAGVVLLLSSVWMCRRGPQAATVRLVWLTWVIAFVPVVLTPVEAHRYLVPALALGACLVGMGLSQVLSMINSTRAHPTLSALVATGILVQPAWQGLRAVAAGGQTTQQLAVAWCEGHLTDSDVILSEAYGPYLVTHDQKQTVLNGPLFRAASSSIQAAYRAMRPYHLAWLPMLVGGSATIRLPSAPLEPVSVYPHAVDWNAAVYDVRLLRGVDYCITSSAIRSRYDTILERFAEQRAFYAFLDSAAEIVAHFQPTSSVSGPTITVYHLTSLTQQQILAVGPLDVAWWLRTVPGTFRARATKEFASEIGLGARSPLPSWTQSLRGSFQDRYAEFVLTLSQHLAATGQQDAAEQLLLSYLAILPGDIDAAMLFSFVAGQLSHWSLVAEVVGRSCAAQELSGAFSPELTLAHAEACLRIGNAHAAGLDAARIIAVGPSPFYEQAQTIAANSRKMPR